MRWMWRAITGAAMLAMGIVGAGAATAQELDGSTYPGRITWAHQTLQLRSRSSPTSSDWAVASSPVRCYHSLSSAMSEPGRCASSGTISPGTATRAA